MRLARFALPLCAVLLSACAGAPGGECHGESWYRLGLNDGMQDAQAEAKRYEASCGNEFDRARYQEGYRDGLARRPKPPAPR